MRVSESLRILALANKARNMAQRFTRSKILHQEAPF